MTLALSAYIDRVQAALMDDGTIFTETFAVLPEVPGETALMERWTTLRAVRTDVQKRLEELRERGAIGSSLQAEVEIRAAGTKAELLQSLGDDLRFVLITSQARVTVVSDAADEGIVVTASSATKCERCWHWRDDVGRTTAHPTLCGRCVSNLFGAGEPRTVA